MRSETYSIESVECHVVKIGDRAEDHSFFPGTDYYPNEVCVYSSKFEQTLVKITSESGRHGWGEVQAPVIPEVSAKLIETLLGLMILGETPGTWKRCGTGCASR